VENENGVIERPQARRRYGRALSRPATRLAIEYSELSCVGFYSALWKANEGVDDLAAVIG
jgi:hypothetical protein